MKKLFIWAAITAAAMSSCSSDEDFSVMQENPQNVISFDTYVGQATETKGIPVTGLLANGEKIGIYGFYDEAAAGWSAIYQNTTAANYMNNEEAACDGTKWSYSPTKYWPASGMLNFWAYYPYTASSVTTAPAGGKSGVYNVQPNQFSYVVGSGVVGQKDLLCSSLLTNLTKNSNGTSGVHFRMQHLLTKIAVNVRLKEALPADGGATVTLKRVTIGEATGTDANGDGDITGFYTNGTYTLFDNNSSTPTWGETLTGAQKFEKTFDPVVSFGTDKIVIFGSDNADANDFLLLLPQDFSGDNNPLPIFVEYAVDVTDGDNFTAVATSLLPQNFEAGKAYALNLSLGLKALEVSVNDITDWGEADVIEKDNLSWQR